MKVLIVDDDSDIRDIIEFTFNCEIEAEFSHAGSGNEAIKFLEQNNDVNLIICDYNMPEGNGGDVYTYLLENNRDLPFAFCSSEHSKDHDEFNDKKYLLGDITKPYIYEGIQKIIESYNHLENKTEEIHKNKNDYLEVNLDILIKAQHVPCDVFIQLGDKKIIKVLNEKDPFTQDELKKYTDKGLQSLLILREKAPDLICHVVGKIEKILSDETIEAEEKVFDAHSVIMSTVAHLGLSEKVIRATASSVDFALETFAQSKGFKSIEKHIFGSPNEYLTSHSIAVSFISVAILKNTNWDTPDTRNKLVLAGFLHDATIRDPALSESIFETESRLLSVKSHPEDVQKLLGKLKNVPMDLDRILIEHHERPEGGGFPKGISGKQIHPLSSVFIFSHDIVDILFELQSKNEEVNEVSIQMKMKIDDYSIGNFEKCYDAFLKTKIFK